MKLFNAFIYDIMSPGSVKGHRKASLYENVPIFATSNWHLFDNLINSLIET